MITKLIKRIRSKLLFGRVRKANRIAEKTQQKLAAASKRLDKQKKLLLSVKKQLEFLIKSVEEDLDEASEAVQGGEFAVKALQEQVDIYKDITVPELVAAHRLVLERTDAQTAIAVKERARLKLEEQ